MKPTNGPQVIFTLLLAAGALITASGCNSRRNLEDKSAAGASSAEVQIDMNCLGNRVENPPEVFHYSYKAQTEQVVVDKEADITPETMEITIQDKSGTHSYHGARSDSASWNSAILDLTGSGLTGMTARIAFVKDNSATTRVAAEAINGYHTTKYSIDTAAANSSDKQTFATLFGSGSYDKGTIWVTEQGCPVKLVLDEAKQGTNGIVDKAHYELALVRK